MMKRTAAVLTMFCFIPAITAQTVQQKSIKLQTRMGTTSSVSTLRFANTLGALESTYKLDLAAEFDVGYSMNPSYELGAAVGSYNAEPAADNGSFRATQLNFYGKYLAPFESIRPHGSAGVGFTSVSFRTPATLFDPEGRRNSMKAPSIFGGTGFEWRVSGFHFDFNLRYHVIFINNRSFLSYRNFGGAFEREYRLKNNATYLSVSGGFIFEFPISD